MKGIFSKAGNKKNISGKMDRRGVLSPSGGANQSPAQGQQAVVSPNGRVNSFIPTSATYHSHMNGHTGKQIPTPMQHQHGQQMPNGVVQQMQHPSHFYSNIPGNSHTSNGPAARQEHHYTNYQQQSIHQSQNNSAQQIHQRTLTKSYSSSQSSHNQQSHYGNTTLYANNNNANHNHNHNAFYGNTANLANGAIIMNGHHGGEKTVMNGHHVSEVMGQAQNSYNHEQVHHHQSQQKVHVQQAQNQRIHQNMQTQQLTQQHLHFQQQTYSNNNNSNNINLNATEGLPSALVESMRTLFDILDDSKQGKIRLSDIETRWESDSNNGSNGKTSGAEPLIKMGVLEYLRKVTPSDGLLTFDRFCSGLRLALLTNNNEVSVDSQVNIKMQSDTIQRQSQPNPPQQYFQEHVRNMTNTTKPPHNQIGPPPPQMFNGTNNSTSHPHNNNIGNIVANKSVSAVHLPTGQNNTIHRLSKIPNFSTSRLPMPNSGQSGIPLSPSNRINNNGGGNANTIPIMNGSKTIPPHHHNTMIGNTKRYPTTTEQGTTVALVHPQPPPNPKPTNANGGFIPNSYSTLGTNKGNQKVISNSGFQNRFSSKNSSLDDLQVPNDESMQSNSLQKERPPSAPLLDGEDTSKGSGTATQQSKQMGRERAKSQERDRVVNNGYNQNNSNHTSRAEEKSNFVKSRQRTLSMPQLQLNKLKPKSVVNFDEPSQEKVIAQQPVENNYPRPSAFKNSGHSLSKLLSGTSFGSSIPTASSANNTLNSALKQAKGEAVAAMISSEFSSTQKRIEKESKELPPPPPKPPRNAMNGPGPVTISTTLINGVTQDPPLSGSSFGSGETQSSSATISMSASSSSGTNSGKPEIRNVLNSWQKNMTDKKPVKPSLSVTSIGTNSSVNTNETTKSAPPTAIIMNSNSVERGTLSNGPINPTSDDAKLRQQSKSNLKRKETARRHTVQSGIDFSTLKRLKQLEQERDVMQQGLSYLEKANEWYLKQLETANDKIGLLSKGAPTADYWSESHEERLNLLGCRISEVNSLLTALMDCSTQLPLHMNLQIPSHLSLRTITRLKDQNRQLTQEVSDYSHRVTQLENEKAMLLRQLFHQKNNSTSDETVYM